MICDFLARPAVVALLVSTVGGVPVTFIWSFLWHLYANIRDAKDSGAQTKGGDFHKERDWPSVIVGGIAERGFATALILWLPGSTGPIVAAWIVVKAAGSWGVAFKDSVAGRRRYYVHLMGSLGSIGWAVAWGMWATAHR